MTRDRPPLTALVATRARPALLEGCLQALAATLVAGDQLMVVESGGDGGAAVVRGVAPPGVDARHLRVEPPGKCRQLNAGLREATGRVVLLTDDDVRVPSSWADAMAGPFLDETVGMAFGRVRGLSRVPGAAEDPGLPPGEAPVETWRFAHGAAMAVRLDAAFDAGGFDERLGPGAPAAGEDHDLVLRVRERGWRVVIAAAEPVEHLEWRSAEEDRANAVVYERAGGAVLGTAVRRSWRTGLPLLRRRLSYQRSVFEWNPRFGPRALLAFAGGMAYGLRLEPRNWLAQVGDRP